MASAPHLSEVPFPEDNSSVKRLPNNGLPVIETNNRQLRDKRNDMVQAIARANDPPRLFHGDSGLVVVDDDKDGNPVLHSATRNVIQDVMADAANWTHTTSNGKRKITPPRDLAENYLAQPRWEGVPPIDGIVTAPIVAADGTICATSGYHPSARLYVSLPEHFSLPNIEPTAANLKAALSLILDTLLGEVAFADDASRAHAVALMILPFVRQIIKGPTPLHLIDAPTQSSGKSYCAKLCITPFTRPTFSSTKGEEEEWRKAILAALLSGRSHIMFDNVKGKLNSPMLAGALTEPHVTERAMGGLGEVTVAIRCVWVATSNNALLDSDMASRSVVIRLDTSLEDPESRQFSRDPIEYIKSHRPQVIGAILTLIRHWQEQGCPSYEGDPASRFPHWQAIIGGILQAAGIDGFLENLQQFRNSLDPEKTAWTALTQAWLDEYQHRYVATKDLMPIALEISEIAASLGEREGRAQVQRLGRQLQVRRDKVFGNLKIVAGIAGRNGATYRLVPSDEPHLEEPEEPAEPQQADLFAAQTANSEPEDPFDDPE